MPARFIFESSKRHATISPLRWSNALRYSLSATNFTAACQSQSLGVQRTSTLSFPSSSCTILRFVSCFSITCRHAVSVFLAWLAFASYEFGTCTDHIANTLLSSCLYFESATSRMVQRQQRSMGEPSERERYSLYFWIYLQDSACGKLSRFGVRENLYFRE